MLREIRFVIEDGHIGMSEQDHNLGLNFLLEILLLFFFLTNWVNGSNKLLHFLLKSSAPDS